MSKSALYSLYNTLNAKDPWESDLWTEVWPRQSRKWVWKLWAGKLSNTLPSVDIISWPTTELNQGKDPWTTSIINLWFSVLSTRVFVMKLCDLPCLLTSAVSVSSCFPECLLTVFREKGVNMLRLAFTMMEKKRYFLFYEIPQPLLKMQHVLWLHHSSKLLLLGVIWISVSSEISWFPLAWQHCCKMV